VIEKVIQYFELLGHRLGEAWNRFWFTPSDVFPCCLLRIFVGLAGLYYLMSFNSDLTVWFGPDGLVTTQTVRSLTASVPGELAASSFHFSYLNWFHSPTELRVVHVVGLAVLTMFTVGLFTRISSVLAFIAVLSYVQRAPMLTGQFEAVLLMMMFYLCLSSSGEYLSLDQLRKKKINHAVEEPSHSWTATVCLRLIQVHLALFYLVTGLSMWGLDTWWLGDATWWLLARSGARLADLTFLYQFPLLLNCWTHSVVAFVLLFAVLVWLELARPILTVASVVVWSSLALITGLVPYCILMIVGNIAYARAETLRSWGARWGWQTTNSESLEAPSTSRPNVTGPALSRGRRQSAGV